MYLSLDRLDLKSEFQKKHLWEIGFDNLSPEVQSAVKAVGCGVIWEFDKSGYEEIYPPRECAVGLIS
jgi:hypothetical protein